jgi:hypothetical protein
MKKIVLLATVAGVMVLAAVLVFRSISAQNSPAGSSTGVSPRAAQSLQKKIDDIKKTQSGNHGSRPTHEISVSEVELESYVIYSLRDQIPVQVDSIDVQLTPGAVGADTQLTLNSNTTGNPISDALLSGTHNLFVKGALSGSAGQGKFDLLEVRVDGIPVPKILIEALIDRYVKPRYPEVDLKEPFDLPWGIHSIDIQSGKAAIRY